MTNTLAPSINASPPARMYGSTDVRRNPKPSVISEPTTPEVGSASGERRSTG